MNKPLSPRPWRINHTCTIVDANGEFVAIVSYKGGKGKLLAKGIVDAINALPAAPDGSAPNDFPLPNRPAQKGSQP